MQASSLVKDFETLVGTVALATDKKAKTLLKMNGLISSFNESWEFASAEQHIPCELGAEVIYQAGDDYGCEVYIKDLHPKLIDAISQEASALEELTAFITALNISVTVDIDTPLSALAIRAGKIVIDVTASV
jgi:hypothetical protein